MAEPLFRREANHLFTPEEELRIANALSAGWEFQWAKQRLLRTLREPPRVMPCYALRRLARRVSGELYHGVLVNQPHWRVPLGWAIEYEYAWDTLMIMPLWLYWPRILWRKRYHWLFRPLIRMHLWEVTVGWRYTDGHWRAPNWLRALLHDKG